MIKVYRSFAAVGLALTPLLWSHRASAQEQETPNHAKNETKALWSIAAGTDLGRDHFDPGDARRADFHGLLAREWERGRHFSYRTQLMVGGEVAQGTGLTRQFGSLSELAKYSFRSGSFRPYLVAGPGLYFERQTYRAFGCSPVFGCSTASLPSSSALSTQWSLGMAAGFGVDMKIGRSRFFIEQTLQAPEFLSNWERRDVTRLPLSIGIRF